MAKEKNKMTRQPLTEERLLYINKEYIDELCARYNVEYPKLAEMANINYFVFYRFVKYGKPMSIAELLKIEVLVLNKNIENLHEHFSKKQVQLIKDVILKK